MADTNTSTGVNQQGNIVIFDNTTGTVKSVINAKTGMPIDLYNPETDVVTQNIRAGVEGALPIVRPIAAGAAALNPSNSVAQAMNPYAGKSPGAIAAATVADVAGTAGNILMPAKGVVANVAKVGIPVLSGIAFKNAADYLQKQDWFKQVAETPVGKITGDYIMPAVSTILSGKAAMAGIKGTPSTIAPYYKQNAAAMEQNAGKFPNTLNAPNTPQGLEKAGFKAYEGARGEKGFDLFTSIKQGIKKEGEAYAAVYDPIKTTIVPKQNVSDLIKSMKAEKAKLSISKEDIALSKDIDKYIGALGKYKVMTVDSLNSLKQAWYKDVAATAQTFQKTASDLKADTIGHKFIDTVDNSLSPEQHSAFKAQKTSYREMALAKDEINTIANASHEQIMQKINNGDKLDALERLSSADAINAAIKADVASKNPLDTGKMMKDYLNIIRKIDETNPELAKKLFNLKDMPVSSKPGDVLSGRLGNIPQTASVELNKAKEIKDKLKIK